MPSTIPVADHYTAERGRFRIKANVDPQDLDGDSRPATFELRMTLGEGEGFPGSASVGEAEWRRLSSCVWRARFY